jgi:predicted TPR repeat methyltransferase
MNGVNDIHRLKKERVRELARQNRLREARAVCHDLCREAENDAEAWFMLGAINGQTGDIEESISCSRRALEIMPRYPEASFNLAQGLMHQGHYADAAAIYRDVLRDQPSNSVACHNLGGALRKLGKREEAAESFRQALRLDPRYAEAYSELGLILWEQNRRVEAIWNYEMAVHLKPDFAEACNRLGNVYRVVGRHADAAVCFQRVLRLKPETSDARYYLAALGGSPVPARTPVELVRAAYAEVSGTYDETHTKERIGYAIPEQLSGLFSARAGDVTGLLVVDMGCGTGLCGPRLRRFADRLIGVDLSPSMLEEARKKQVYDELVCGDLVDFLERHDATFDLAIATGVFIHIGDLTGLFSACGKALRPGGWLGFSAHECEGEDYRLQPTGHYAHSPAYVDKLAAASGFSLLVREKTLVYSIAGESVYGHLYLLKKN